MVNYSWLHVLRPLPQTLIVAIFCAGVSGAKNHSETLCIPPVTPYLPASQEEADEFGAYIAEDAETYFSHAEQYLRCLESERYRTTTEIQRFISNYQDYLTTYRK